MAVLKSPEEKAALPLALASSAIVKNSDSFDLFWGGRFGMWGFECSESKEMNKKRKLELRGANQRLLVVLEASFRLLSSLLGLGLFPNYPTVCLAGYIL